ncbi:RxLR effector protein [Phytophthora megakarya]|uniref:RxLR effector protein n=1 Tax=Phytophthora megakarya TaxID=4795 RepID=A0A225WNY5_9STRA|nr:RxLR effector protein [Phytophthora megakarya]
MIRKESFSALDKVDNPAILDKISDEADDFLISMFKLADQKNMTPRDLANELKTFPDADAAIRAKAVVFESGPWDCLPLIVAESEKRRYQFTKYPATPKANEEFGSDLFYLAFSRVAVLVLQ